MQNSEFILEARRLVKRFGAVTAVDGLSLSVREADLYGLVGLNGAGKTTTLRMMLGLIAPDGGTFVVRGVETARILPAHRASMAALIDTPSLFPRLSGIANVCAIAGLSAKVSRRDAEHALARVGLSRHQSRPAADYSLGMKQRLALAVALAASPKILVLDEPTNGLDPGGISDLRETLLSLREAGMTIVVSSHLLPEVERCATRVGIVRAGRVVAQGSVADVLGDAGRIEIAASPDGRAREVAGRFGTVSTDQGALFLDAPSASVADVNRALVEAGVSVHGIARRRRSLEDIVVGGAEVS